MTIYVILLSVYYVVLKLKQFSRVAVSKFAFWDYWILLVADLSFIRETVSTIT